MDSSGNVYITEFAYVLKETPSGSNYIQSQVIEGYSFNGIAVDAGGNLYLTQYSNLLKGTLSDGSYNLSIIDSAFGGATGVAIDSNGIVYVADGDTAGSGRVVEEIPAYGSYTPIVLYKGALGPTCIAVDWQKNLYVTNNLTNQVLKISIAGVDFGSRAIGVPSSSISLAFTFSSGGTIGLPVVVTQGATSLDFTDAGTGTCTTNGTTHTYNAGDICTVDVIFTPKAPGARYGAALLENSSGSVIASGYLQGIGLGPQVTFPPGAQSTVLSNGSANYYGIAIDGNGSLYVLDATNNRVLKETPFAGGYQQSVVVSGLNNPEGIAIDGAGNIYVSNTFTGYVLKYSPSASGYSQSIIFPSGTPQYPEALAVDGTGNLYIVDNAGNRVSKETLSNGVYTQTTIGTSIYLPNAVAVDSAGVVYIAGSDPSSPPGVKSGWILKETPSNGGYAQSVAASGLGVETGLTVDGNGTLYITDNEDGPGNAGQVYRETPSGSTYTQTTVGKSLSSPRSAAVDGNGNIFIINGFGTGQVLKEDLSDPPVLHFAATAVGQTSSDSPKTVVIQNSGNASMNVPQPTQGYNPSIPSGFTVNDNVASACPLVIASSASAGTLAAGASCNLTISFSPQLSTDTSGWLTYTYDGPDQASSSYQTPAIPLIAGGAQIASTLTWANPSAIVYGTALGGQQLNASANVQGTFSYSPAPGSILTVGSHVLSVTFTPADSTGFTTATAQVTINVTQATPSISWSAPSAITYGTALGSTQLNASSTVAGTITYSPAFGTILTAGSQTLNVTLIPTDTVDYTTATASVTLVVNKATPPITWPAPAPISYGTPLSATQLNATTTVPGSFAYSPSAGSILGAGFQTLSVTFTPTDGTDYTGATANVALTVNRVTPTITWATPAAISYGTALTTLQLDATASVPGTFSYSNNAGSVLRAGSYTLTAYFYPTDSIDYSNTTASVMLVVNKATPTVTWATPAAILYGTALGTTQLNATASVAGTFAYSPASGTVLAVGLQTLTATFTPTDTINYTTAIDTVTLTVTKGTPTLGLISSPNPTYVSAPVIFTATVASAVTTPSGTVSFLDGTTVLGPGALSGGVATYTTSALAVGTHSITAVYSGDGNFTAVTSAALAETVDDFTLTPPTGGSTSATASPGGQANYALAFAPPTGTTFPVAVTFAVSGLPTGATATFSPATISAGSPATNVTLTISVPVQSAAEPVRGPFGGGALPIALGLILLPFAGRLRKASRRLSGMACLAVLSVASAALLAGLAGCGGGSKSTPPAPVSYTLTVTATAGTLSHSTTLNLTVE